jgi:hypothetical protein
MGVNPAIVADSNGHRIYKGDATESTFSRHEIAAQRKQCTWHEFHESVVAYQSGKCPAQMSAYLPGVVVLECPVA